MEVGRLSNSINVLTSQRRHFYYRLLVRSTETLLNVTAVGDLLIIALGSDQRLRLSDACGDLMAPQETSLAS